MQDGYYQKAQEYCGDSNREEEGEGGGQDCKENSVVRTTFEGKAIKKKAQASS